MYIGRFAPSPTGPLHFGSLVAALASYLDAKAHNGIWHVRIEDIDAPRCIENADKEILNTLKAHGLLPDGNVIYQSSRLHAYSKAIQGIIDSKQSYYCQCTRKLLKTQDGVHQRNCQSLAHNSGAIRFLNQLPIVEFYDRALGVIHIDDAHALEDFIIKRKDGLFAYNLVVVLDDIMQGITHIVRGEDLLSTTSAHLSLYHYFKASIPSYLHIPLVKDKQGKKLSKQNHAPPIKNENAAMNLMMAANKLGLDLTHLKRNESLENILSFAIEAWHQRWPSSTLSPLI